MRAGDFKAAHEDDRRSMGGLVCAMTIAFGTGFFGASFAIWFVRVCS